MSTPLPREGEPGHQGPRLRPPRKRSPKGPGLLAVAVGVLGAIGVRTGEIALGPVLLVPLLLLAAVAGWHGSRQLPSQATRGVRAASGAPLGAGAMLSVLLGYALATVLGLGGEVGDVLTSLGDPVVTVLVAMASGAAAGAVGSQLVAPRDPDAPPAAW
ncbi:hypothetical protein [Nocardioides marmoraquaticus]